MYSYLVAYGTFKGTVEERIIKSHLEYNKVVAPSNYYPLISMLKAKYIIRVRKVGNTNVVKGN